MARKNKFGDIEISVNVSLNESQVEDIFNEVGEGVLFDYLLENYNRDLKEMIEENFAIEDLFTTDQVKKYVRELLPDCFREISEGHG
jgi:hypothetical protein